MPLNLLDLEEEEETETTTRKEDDEDDDEIIIKKGEKRTNINLNNNFNKIKQPSSSSPDNVIVIDDEDEYSIIKEDNDNSVSKINKENETPSLSKQLSPNNNLSKQPLNTSTTPTTTTTNNNNTTTLNNNNNNNITLPILITSPSDTTTTLPIAVTTTNKAINSPNNSNNNNNTTEEEKVYEVKQCKDNILNLFSSAQSKWSEYYTIEHTYQPKTEVKGILAGGLKEKLAALKTKKKLGIVTEGLQTNNVGIAGMGGTGTPTLLASTTSTPTLSSVGSVGSISSLEGTGDNDENNTTPLLEDEDSLDIIENEEDLEEQENNEGFIKIDEFTTNSMNGTNNGVVNHEHDIFKNFETDIPWQTKDYSKYSPSLRLHYELIDFYNFIKQTKEEEIVRKRVIEKVSNIILEIDPKAKIQLFGSYPCGLMLPGSDLDFHVFTKLQQKTFLRKLNYQLKESEDFINIDFISQARVPIVKFKERQSRQEIDVSCNNGDTDYSVQFIKNSSQKFPAFKYLCYFLKYFLKQRNLNIPMDGGISSYGISLMIINHLQMHSSNSSIEDRDVTSLGTLLLDFLALYGKYLNFYTTNICPEGNGKYERYINQSHSLKNGFKGMIKDPCDPKNNVIRGTSQLLLIRLAFSNAFDALVSPENVNRESLLSVILHATPDLCWRRIYIHNDVQFLDHCDDHIDYFTSKTPELMKKRNGKGGDKVNNRKKRKKNKNNSGNDNGGEQKLKKRKQQKKNREE
ncbi:hypothetical protein ABK040_001452 [Willaertia magna]